MDTSFGRKVTLFHFSGNSSNKNGGFTLIELMIVVAVIAIILTLAVPTYANFMIRSRINEALSVSNAAKTAVASACQADQAITMLTPDLAGYSFTESRYVAGIDIDGPCTAPHIKITTRNTGAVTDPVLTLTGDFQGGSARTTWTCVSSGLNVHVPETCRS